MDLGPRLLKAGDSIVYGVPLWRRLVFGVIGLALTGLMVYDGAVSALPLILAIGAFAGSCYADDWVFRISRNELQHHVGVYPFPRREVLPLDLIAGLRIEKFGPNRESSQVSSTRRLRGGLGVKARDRRFCKLSVEFGDGRSRVLNIERSGSGQMAQDAERLAQMLGVALDQLEP
jgi:hypothetical protein